ncbi:MAG TPA: hypothetical protein DCE41_03875 [Cytophagales bacterium]|nr:hypothetical protein [Cytophagales bacterium]HAA21211.1 hypothetical protein [Cytophagales bacterium]HAP60258.1 hypothetical protein [Cytophagales bacterium]
MKHASFLLLMLSFSACTGAFFDVSGNGNIVSENREIQDFSRIHLKGGYQVLITEGNTPSVEIETDENLMEYIKTEVKGDRLIIESTSSLYSQSGIVINITYTSLEAIDVSGAASVENYGTVAGESLDMNISGAAEIDLKVDVMELDINTSGAGSLSLSGEAQDASFSLSGAGNVEAYSLTTTDCKVSVSGVGGAEVYVTGRLDAQVSGVGGISYKGDPEDVSQKVSGIGSIGEAN